MNSEDIDSSLAQIQKSTKTTFKFFIPTHDRLRLKYAWYYKWHINPVAKKVHLGVLGTWVAACLVFVFLNMQTPLTYKGFAAGLTCTSLGTGNWSDAGTWTDCGGGVPGTDDNAVIATSHNVTLTGTTNIGTGDITINGTLTTANNTLSLESMTIATGGTLTAGSSTITASGNWDHSAGTFTYNTSTINLTGVAPTFNSGSNGTVYNLQATTSGQTVNISGVNTSIMGTLTVGSTSGNMVTLTGTSGNNIWLKNTTSPIVFNGAYNTNPGYVLNSNLIVRYSPNGAGVVVGGTYGRLSICPTATATMTMQGNITTTGFLEIWGRNGAYTATLDTTAGNNYSVTAGTLTMGLSATRYGKLKANDSSITVSGNLTITASDASGVSEIDADTSDISVSGNWANGDTFTADTSTVTLTGNASANQTITTNNQAFNNLTLYNDEATYDDAIISGNLDVDGTLTLTDGQLQLATNDPTVTLAGAVNIASIATWTKQDNGSATTTFNGTSTFTDSSATAQDIGLVAVNGTSLTLGSAMTVTTMTVTTGTLNLGASSYILKLNGTGATATVLSNSGTFTAGTSIVQFTATNSGGNVNIPTLAYSSLQLTPGSAETYDMTGSLTTTSAMTGNLTIDSNATLDPRPSSTDYSLTAVNVTINGTLDATSSSATFTASGNWDHSAGTFTRGTSTVDLTGTGNLTVASAGSESQTFYNLNLSTNSTTTTILGSANVGVRNILTLGNGKTITSSTRAFQLYLSGTPLVNNGATITTTDMYYVPSSSTNVTGGAYYRIFLYPQVSSALFTLQGNLTGLSQLSVGDNWSDNKAATFDSNGYDITITGSNGIRIGSASSTLRNGVLENLHASIKSTVTTTSVTIYSGSGNNKILANGTQTIDLNVSGNWSNSDTFTAGSSTVTLTGNSSAHQTITTNNQAFNNLTLYNDEATYDDAIISGNLDVDGTLTLTDGQLDLATNDPTVTLAGAVNIANGPTWTKQDNGSATTTFNGTSTFTDSSATPQDIGLVAVNGTSLTLGSSMTVTTMTVTSGILNLGASSYILKLNGTGATGTVLSNSGTFTAGTSTVQYSAVNSGGDVTVTTLPYSTLKLSGAETYDLAGHQTTTNALTGDLTIDNGAILTTTASNYNLTAVNVTIAGTLTVNSSIINVGGNWTNSGTFGYGGSVVFTANGNITSGGTTWGAHRFKNLTINDGVTMTVLTNDIGVDTTLTVGAGAALTGGSRSVWLYATSGTLLSNSGTITGLASIIYRGTGTNIPVAATTYPRLTIMTGGNDGSFQAQGAIVASEFYVDNSTATKTSTFNTNNQTLTVNGNLNIGNYAGHVGNGAISAGSSTINVSGNVTISADGSFTAGTSTITLTGNSSANQTITTNNQAFYNLTIYNDEATYDDAIISGNLDIDGTLTLTDGELKLSTNNPAVNLAGTVSIASGATWTKGSGTTTFDGTTTYTDSNTTKQNLGTTVLNGTSLGQSSAITVDSLAVTSGTWTTNNNNITDNGNLTIGGTLSAGSSTISIGGDYSNTSTLTSGTSTFDFTKSSATQTLTSGGTGAGKPFYHLTHSGAGTLQLASSNALQVNGNLANSAGTLDANGQNISVKGNWNISGGSFSAGSTPGTQTVTLSGDTPSSPAVVSGSTNFNNLTLNSSDSTSGKSINFTASTTQTVSGTTTISGASSKIITLNRTGASGVWNLAIPAGFTSGQYINVSNNTVSGGTIIPGNYLNVTDGGGNTGWNFDTDAPVPTLTTNPVSPNGDNGYFKAPGPVGITLSGTDIESGVASMSYRWGASGEYTTVASDTTTFNAPEGTTTLYYYATDNIGNTTSGSPATQQFKVDTTTPTVSVAASPTGPNGSNNYFIGTAPSLTLTGADSSGSGIASIKYRWNSEAYQTYTTALTAPEGINTLNYYAIDNAGNSGAGSAYSVAYNVELTIPTVTLTSNPVTPNGTNSYYITSAPSITLSATDPGSGVASIKYQWASGTLQTYSTAFSAPEGTTILTYYSISNAGNESEHYTQTFKIDLTDPITDITLAPASPNGSNSYYTSAPAVTLANTDAGSGAGSIFYRFGTSGDFSQYGSAITPPEGTNTIYYYGMDNANNETETYSREIKLDTSAPILTVSADPTAPDTTAGYYTTAPTITISAADTNSGVSAIKYRWGSTGDYSAYSEPLTAPENTNTLYYYGIDNAGNDGNADPSTTTYLVDTTVPVIINSTPSATTPTNNLTVPFSWNTASDGSGSGIDHYLVTIGSATGLSDIANAVSTSTATYTKTFTTTGTYYIRIKAVDLVGHISDFSAEGSVLIDQTNPIITLSDLVDGQYINTKTITLKGTSSDSIPGISKVQISIDDNSYLDVSSADSFKTWTYDWKDYSEGRHTIIAKAIDTAANEITSTKFIIIIDTVAPSQAPDLRVFNVSNPTSNIYTSYLDFADSTDETSGIKSYELYRDGIKLADIPITKDSANKYYSGNSTQPFFYVDENLSSKAYSYKIKATDNAANTSETAETKIDLASAQVEADSISNAKATPSKVVDAKGKTSAVIMWNTSYPATTKIKYGTSTKYDKESELDSSLNQGHLVLLKDLKPSTSYHAKAVSVDTYGKELESPDLIFTTTLKPSKDNAIQLVVRTLKEFFSTLFKSSNAAESTTDKTKELRDFANNLQLTDISYPTKNFYEVILTYPNGSKISKDGSTLSASGTYFIDKSLSNTKANAYQLGDGQAISRKPSVGDDTEIKIKDAEIIKESVSVGEKTGQLLITWQTTRPATSQVEFGQDISYSQKTKPFQSYNLTHAVLIEELSPATVYHFRVNSADTNGKIASSSDFSFKIPELPKQEDPFDLIVNSFQKVFAFVQGMF